MVSAEQNKQLLSVSDKVYAVMLPGGGSSGPPPAPAPDYPGAGRGGGGAEERRGRSRTAERPRQGVVRRIRSSGPAGPGPAPDMGRSLRNNRWQHDMHNL